MKRDEALGHFAAIFCILVWGLTFISTKILLRDFCAFSNPVHQIPDWLACVVGGRAEKISTNNKKTCCFCGGGI